MGPQPVIREGFKATACNSPGIANVLIQLTWETSIVKLIHHVAMNPAHGIM